MVKILRSGLVTPLIVPNTHIAVDEREERCCDRRRDCANESWLVARCVFLSEDERAHEIAYNDATSVLQKEGTIGRKERPEGGLKSQLELTETISNKHTRGADGSLRVPSRVGDRDAHEHSVGTTKGGQHIDAEQQSSRVVLWQEPE
jgi:hypothetical protein